MPGNLSVKKGDRNESSRIAWDKLFFSGIIHWIPRSFPIVRSVYLSDILDYTGKQRESD